MMKMQEDDHVNKGLRWPLATPQGIAAEAGWMTPPLLHI